MISSFAARATVRRPCGGTSGSPAVQRSEDGVDREPARNLAGRVPTHAVGEHEDRPAVPRVIGRGRHECCRHSLRCDRGAGPLSLTRPNANFANVPDARIGPVALVGGLSETGPVGRRVASHRSYSVGRYDAAGEPRPSARSAREGAGAAASHRSASARRHRSCCSRSASCGSGCGILALTPLTASWKFIPAIFFIGIGFLWLRGAALTLSRHERRTGDGR